MTMPAPPAIGAAVPEAAGFRINPADLTRHAGSVDAAVISVNQAAAAGEHVRLGSQAYGVLCQILPAVLDSAQQTAVQAGKDLAFSLSTVADLLRETAYLYEQGEQSIDDMFTDLGSRLSSGLGTTP